MYHPEDIILVLKHSRDEVYKWEQKVDAPPYYWPPNLRKCTTTIPKITLEKPTMYTFVAVRACDIPASYVLERIKEDIIREGIQCCVNNWISLHNGTVYILLITLPFS